MPARLFLTAVRLVVAAASAATAHAQLASDDISALQSALSDQQEIISRHYYAGGKINRDFAARCAAAGAAIAQATDLNQAYALIADAVTSVDPRIRFYPPLRHARADYGWKWMLVGDAGFVVEFDHVADAVTQGLKLGDQILEIEGLPLDRASDQQLDYLFNILSPRPVLRVLAQSPGQPPRLLTIATTIRPQRRTHTVRRYDRAFLEWVYTKHEQQRIEEFKSVPAHFRRVGPVAIWNTVDLRRRIDDVADGFGQVGDAGVLILDLRGRNVHRHETALRLLEGLFTEDFVVGTRGVDGATETLRVHGRSGAFHGTLLVLVDARTGGYAEVIARVVQQRQRGVLIGDHTLGRVLEESFYGNLHETIPYAFNVAGAFIPRGEITLADGTSLDGRGVAPDLLLLPQPADLAARRDVVLARALKMAKQTVTPEEAFKLFWVDQADDEDFDD